MSFIQCQDCNGFFGIINNVIYVCKCSHKSMYCDHANENPLTCPCKQDCYCKAYTCSDKLNLHD